MVVLAQLAALDHNFHLHRQFHGGDGASPIIVQRRWNPRSKQESVSALKVPKDYPYANTLTALCLRSAQLSSEMSNQTVTFDPRNIAPTVRGVVSTPTADLVKSQVSRFC